MPSLRDANSSVDANRKVLGQLVAVVEDHDQVHVELYFELRMDKSGAGVDFREQHIERNLHVRDHIAVCHLDVLHFCC